MTSTLDQPVKAPTFQGVSARRKFSNNLATVLVRLLRHEGPLALFNGWLPTYFRLGPHAILTFPLLEALRGAAGLKYL